MPSRWLSRAVLGLLIVYLLIAVPVGVRNTVLRLRAAARTWGLPAGAVRARVFGPRYTAAVEQIRRAIPVDEPCLLRELDEPGAMLWVRHDLLPRRAIRDMVQRGPEQGPGDCWRDQIRWLVVAAGVGRPPVLLERPVTVPPGCPPAPWLEAASGTRPAP